MTTGAGTTRPGDATEILLTSMSNMLPADGGTSAEVPPKPPPWARAHLLTTCTSATHKPAACVWLRTCAALSGRARCYSPFGLTSTQAVVSLRARALSEGVFRSLRRATGNSASLIPCTKVTLLAEVQQGHFRGCTTCHRQLVGTTRAWRQAQRDTIRGERYWQFITWK